MTEITTKAAPAPQKYTQTKKTTFSSYEEANALFGQLSAKSRPRIRRRSDNTFDVIEYKKHGKTEEDKEEKDT